MRRLRALAVVVMAMLVLAACTPIAEIGDLTGKSAMTVIYDATHQTVAGAWGAVAWIWGLALAMTVGWFHYKMISSGLSKIAKPLVSAIVVGAVVIALGGSVFGDWATQVATHAVQVGADKAKTRKANQYVEKLHLAVTKADIEKRTCNQVSDSGTGCRYEWTYTYNSHIEWDTCTRTTGSGDSQTTETYLCNPHEVHNTMHVPFFKEEWRAYANVSMPDEYLLNKVGEDSGTGLIKTAVANNPIKYYTDWQAPEPYQQYWYGNDTRFGKTPDQIEDFQYLIPKEWHLMNEALSQQRPYILTVYHSYVNWVFITADSNNLVTTSSLVAKYKAAGLLPQINMIYSRAGNSGVAGDYDFVQFGGGLTPADFIGWQDAAGLASLKIGPGLQGSLTMFFVPAEAVDNPDAWIQAAKARLSDVGEWGFNMAPKNLILIGCGVDRSAGLIKFCRMETGMPSGNVNIRYTIDHLTDIPFTTQGVFGDFAGVAKPDASGFYATDITVPDNGIIKLLFAGGDAGFKRVQMRSLDWLKTDIKLDRADIIWAVTTETESARNWAFGWDVIGVLFALGMVYVLYNISDSEDYTPPSRRYSRY